MNAKRKVTLNLDDITASWLANEAKKQRRSMSDIVRTICLQEMNKDMESLSPEEILEALAHWIRNFGGVYD